MITPEQVAEEMENEYGDAILIAAKTMSVLNSKLEKLGLKEDLAFRSKVTLALMKRRLDRREKKERAS